MSEADLEWERIFKEFEPTNLLEAVYCDPCKAKVIDVAKISMLDPLSPGFMLFPDNKFSAIASRYL